MKFSNIKNLVLLLTAGLLLGSCKKYLDVNSTPNNPTSVPPSVLLPNTTIGIAFANGNDLNRASSALVQHIAGVANQTASYDVYNFSGAFDNQWNGELYNGAIANSVVLINLDSATSPIYSGIAKLEMAYAFSMVTDVWGDVPYSQAGQGLKFLTPRFDKVQDIYQGNATLGITGLLDLVKSGLADLDKPNNALKPTKDDIVYAGDATKWKRFGNSLLLKFAMQMSNTNAAVAKSTIQSVIDGNNFINANTLDFDVPFGSSVGNQNPIYSFNYVNRPGDQMLSLRFLNLMRSLNDTVRLARLFTKPNGAFTGYDNGTTTAAPAQASRSQYGAYFVGTTGSASLHLLTNYQVNFILAEAALVLGTTGDANAYYQAGIKAHMQKIGMADADITAYFTANPTIVTLAGTTEDKRKQIITQKYISNVGNGIEAWNDYRRTGYPVLALPNNPGGDDPTVIPTRLPYTNGELSNNPNAPNPRPLVNVKLWWAK
ncbi:MAG: SusD/RagB family nutrient-binding outer membrane lipoprotein [Bacteroidetes bacterium]|nr:SusD/RagB family nutrient-binding outer membrane lipoprotein [Bacteroidota bacterium]